MSKNIFSVFAHYISFLLIVITNHRSKLELRIIRKVQSPKIHTGSSSRDIFFPDNYAELSTPVFNWIGQSITKVEYRSVPVFHRVVTRLYIYHRRTHIKD